MGRTWIDLKEDTGKVETGKIRAEKVGDWKEKAYAWWLSRAQEGRQAGREASRSGSSLGWPGNKSQWKVIRDEPTRK